MKLDSKQFVPFVLMTAFLGLVAIVFFPLILIQDNWRPLIVSSRKKRFIFS